jgi:hypothetical protein
MKLDGYHISSYVVVSNLVSLFQFCELALLSGDASVVNLAEHASSCADNGCCFACNISSTAISASEASLRR